MQLSEVLAQLPFFFGYNRCMIYYSNNIRQRKDVYKEKFFDGLGTLILVA